VERGSRDSNKRWPGQKEHRRKTSAIKTVSADEAEFGKEVVPDVQLQGVTTVVELQFQELRRFSNVRSRSLDETWKELIGDVEATRREFELHLGEPNVTRRDGTRTARGGGSTTGTSMCRVKHLVG
jgi:hypothetical protein